MAYSELLPYATLGFVAFGAGSLLTGWLWRPLEPPLHDGDLFARHRRLDDRGRLRADAAAARRGAALDRAVLASIYHPVGTAMIVSYADRLGREMGLNGVWGNLGVASSALVTGVIGQYLGWCAGPLSSRVSSPS